MSLSFFLDNAIPNDCTSLHNINCGLPSGLYTIKLPFLNHVTVFCDMETDGGGWTVRTFLYTVIYSNQGSNNGIENLLYWDNFLTID